MRVVLANGCFDPLHYGHVLHLQAAKQMGGMLIVSVTKNEHVNKGPGRPVFDECERMAMVTALKCVTAAILSVDALDALRQIRPAVFVKGEEYEGSIQREVLDYCKENNIEISYTRGKRYSSSKLLRHYSKGGERDHDPK